jgi:hypothetical protein
MTTPQPIPAVDPANQLLAEVPSQLTTAIVDTPLGQRLVLTIRTASTTVSVLLNGADAKTWSGQISRDAAMMSAAGLVVPNGAMVPKGGDGS